MSGGTKRVRIKSNCFVSIYPHVYAPMKRAEKLSNTWRRQYNITKHLQITPSPFSALWFYKESQKYFTLHYFYSTYEQSALCFFMSASQPLNYQKLNLLISYIQFCRLHT